jgi:hypothetical protein
MCYEIRLPFNLTSLRGVCGSPPTPLPLTLPLPLPLPFPPSPPLCREGAYQPRQGRGVGSSLPGPYRRSGTCRRMRHSRGRERYCILQMAHELQPKTARQQASPALPFLSGNRERMRACVRARASRTHAHTHARTHTHAPGIEAIIVDRVQVISTLLASIDRAGVSSKYLTQPLQGLLPSTR